MLPASAQINRSTKTLCALALILSLQLTAFAAKKKPAPKKDLAKEITAILSQPPLDRAHWGVDVVDLSSGKTVYSQNADQLFMPASNTKLFTTAAALAIAGPDYRFHTTVEAEGRIDKSGRLLGDLAIIGRGDPNISGRVLPYAGKTQRTPPHTQILEEMADQVAKTGLKMVDGDVIGDDTYYAFEKYAEGWALDDLQWSDGAPISALSFNDNVIFLNVLPGELAGDKALITVEPETGYYELDNRILTTAAGVTRKIGIHRDPGAKKIVLWGTIPIGDAGVKETLAIEDPAEFTAELFCTLLERRGIVVRGKVRARHGEGAQFSVASPAATDTAATQQAPAIHPSLVLAEHVSAPLLDDIRVTNKTSQNLHAELALRLVGKLRTDSGSFEAGAAAVKQFLLQAGITDEEFSFLDGSGLSRRDLVTPAAMIKLLVYADKQPWGAAFAESLPVGGVDGSLADRFLNTPAAGQVHAKTGSLSHVNALSGYLPDQHLAFSIFCNNHNMPGSKVLTAMDAVVQLLVGDEK